jgi:Na+-driven multidrug efflux pump
LQRGKKTVLNASAALLLEIITVICGFILPRLILSAFGSSYNGVTASIVQFLSWVALLRSGIGGVTRAALYSPLANHDKNKLNSIIKATDIFMKKVAIVFVILLLLFASLYPFLVLEDFSWVFTFSLVCIIGSSTFVQNYFGITYKILLQSDQKQYVISVIEICSTIINTIIAAILIKGGCGIHLVKLGSAIVFIFNPIIINLYTRKKYEIDLNVEPDNQAIKQRWDAFAQQIATLVNNNTDLMVLTIFTNVREVSVYSVYYMVINGISKFIITCSSGVDAAFGNMLAKKEDITLKQNFSMYEWLIYTLGVTFFSVTSVMIVPFVQLYTKGVTDVNYSRLIFSNIMCLALLGNCLRLPYQMMVEAAGHFKQTKKGAIIEAVLNIVISVFLVNIFGIVGVAIGTLAATMFRTLQYSYYMSKNIIVQNWFNVLKRLIIYMLGYFSIYFISNMVPLLEEINYFYWIINSLIVFLIALFVTIAIGICFYRKDMIVFYTKIHNIFLKKRRRDANN